MMLKNFITQKDGSVSLEDYQVALDEILRLRKRVDELETAQQSVKPTIPPGFRIVPMEELDPTGNYKK